MTSSLPLELVLGLVAVGVPAVVWLAHRTGGSVVVPLDEAIVGRLLAQEAPDRSVGVVAIDPDGSVALVRADDGSRWVAWTMESHHALRSVGAGAWVAREGAIEVRLGDAGWPARRVRVADPASWLEADRA